MIDFEINDAEQALQGQSDLVAVPREPTEEMIAAGYKEVGRFQYEPDASIGLGDKARAIYKAMINEGE